MQRGAQIVDVLPANEYAEQHLPGAISIPLKRLNAETVSGLDRMEGTKASILHAGDLAQRDVPTCQLDDDLSDVVSRLRESGWDACPVVNDEQVVLGLLRLGGLDGLVSATVEQHKESGPSTWRPDATLDQPLAYMDRRNVESVVITASDGRLVGLLLRSDAEHLADASRSEVRDRQADIID